MGAPKEVRPGRGEFHENPHTCICEDADAKEKKDTLHRKYGKAYNTTGEDFVNDDQNVDEDQEMPDFDDDGSQERGQVNGTTLDYDGFSSEEPEIEELLSD